MTSSDPDQVKTVSWPLRVEKKRKAAPIPEGTAYYCAFGSFVTFRDIAGFDPTQVSYEYFGAASALIGDAPYDGLAAMNGMAFPPVGGTHQTQIGDFTYVQGGYATQEAAEAACEETRQRVDDFFGSTATISYAHSDKCSGAIGKLLDAKSLAKRAKAKLDHAHGAAVGPTRQALQNAKAKLKKAKKKYKKQCK